MPHGRGLIFGDYHVTCNLEEGILSSVEENGHAVDLEYKTQSLGATVSAMLSAEFKKSDSRLIRVGRGVYNLRGS